MTNTIYVANSGVNTVTVINGTTKKTYLVSVGTDPNAIAVNPVTNTTYVSNGNSSNVTVIRTSTSSSGVLKNATTTVSAGTGPEAIAVNPITNTIYVPNGSSDNVTIIREQQVQASPLATQIEPLPGNRTSSPMPTFDLTVESSFFPVAPVPQAAWYQLDTWEGPWLAASGTAPNFTLTTPSLSLGTHILYAFATDGQDANSTGVAQQFIGTIASYLFLVK